MIIQDMKNDFELSIKNKTFGRLTIIDRVSIKKDGQKPRVFFVANCTCGSRGQFRADQVLTGQTKSCGCLDQETKTKHNAAYSEEYRSWLKIKTKCFNLKANGYIGDTVTMDEEWKNSFEKFFQHVGPKPSKDHILARLDLEKGYFPGNVKWLHKSERQHNFTGSPTYQSWSHMKERCLNPNNDRYADYGGRGIVIDPEWMDFKNFLRDMGERPDGTSLDRIDVDGPYTKSNCRWATRAEQMRNRRFAQLNEELVIKIKQMHRNGVSITQISKELNIKYSTISSVVNGYSWKDVGNQPIENT